MGFVLLRRGTSSRVAGDNRRRNMKRSLQALVTEATGAEHAMTSSVQTSTWADQTVENVKQELSRLQSEAYRRVLAGETTGNKIDDIVIATKGRLDRNISQNLRALMEKFAQHKGEFVAGHHRHDTHLFSHVLIGIISPGEPLFCFKPDASWTKPYIELPIRPAVSYDSSWQWAFNNLHKDKWRIYIDQEETLKRNRCWELERLIEVDVKNPSICIGDEAVWDFVLKTGRHKFGPIVTFAHVASALGRPLSTIPAFKERIQPFVAEVKSLVPSFTKAHKVLVEIEARFEKLGEQPFVKDVFDETRSALHDVKDGLDAMKAFLKIVERPHKIKKAKS